MAKVKFTDLFAVVLFVIPFLVWFLVKDKLPDNVTIHWGINGEPNGWIGKGKLPFILLLIGGLGFGVYMMLRFIKRIDPKRSAQMNEDLVIRIGTAVLTVNTLLCLVILIPGGIAYNVTSVVLVAVSLLFAFIGNVMYNIKPNYFVGIRLPWTLENADNWRQTHRLAGIIWFAGGLLSAALALVVAPASMFVIFIVITVLLVAIPTVYSFMRFRRMQTLTKQ